MQFRTAKVRSDEPSLSTNNINGLKSASSTKVLLQEQGYHKKESVQVIDKEESTRHSFRATRTEDTAEDDNEQVVDPKFADYGSIDVSLDAPNDFDIRFWLSNIKVNKNFIINLLAIAGLVYAVATVYSINERSKIAYNERIEASLAVNQAQYDIPVNNVAVSTLNREMLQPDRIEISSIGVNALIDEMGVTESNNIEAPATNHTAGWFNQSSVINESGATIIDGHLGSNIDPGVFWNLEELVVGDTITLHAKNGDSAYYVIRETEVVDRNSTNFDKYYNSIGDGNGLNIITCNGGYLQQEATYDSRLIVYAEQVYS